MNFCPRCGALLLPDANKRLKCGCGYVSRQNKIVVIKEKVENNSKIEVVDKQIQVLPKMEIDCPKCGNEQAYYWTVQTRASDEAETIFFRCCKCNHQWRQY
ncbi:MAG: transcription factor S [Nanoarchaeota archaeon]|nr:transcription factor S [Nanoarchaeota archaeon]